SIPAINHHIRVGLDTTPDLYRPDQRFRLNTSEAGTSESWLVTPLILEEGSDRPRAGQGFSGSEFLPLKNPALATAEVFRYLALHSSIELPAPTSKKAPSGKNEWVTLATHRSP